MATWRRWAWRYALPVAALAATAPLTRWSVGDDRNGEILLRTFVVAPVLAFLIGLLVRPACVWVVPAVSVLIEWAGVVVNEAQNPADNSAVGGFVFVVLLMGLPWTVLIWGGRELGQRLGSRLTGASRQGPHAPAT